jgi:hypothetical protein
MIKWMGGIYVSCALVFYGYPHHYLPCAGFYVNNGEEVTLHNPLGGVVATISQFTANSLRV